MAGNVWEWCVTQWRKPHPYQLEDEWQAPYLEPDQTRVLRAGSWGSDQKSLRGAYRYFNGDALYRSKDCGLRVASHSRLPGSEQ
jgi:formylglycine-generating enzyme required for sulfatase activity